MHTCNLRDLKDIHIGAKKIADKVIVLKFFKALFAIHHQEKILLVSYILLLNQYNQVIVLGPTPLGLN